MEEEYATFKKFQDTEDVLELIELLDFNSVPYKLEDHRTVEAEAFLGVQPGNKIELKIRSKDFVYVNSILEAEAEKEIANVEKDHYLFSFTIEELQEIVLKEDEWSKFDFLLAKKILAQKGKIISDKKIEESRNERLKELSKKEVKPLSLIITGYLISFAGCIIALLIRRRIPGLIGNVLFFGLATMGPVMGYLIATGKKVLPDGKKIFVYKPEDRKHGWIIFSVGLLMFVVFVTLVWGLEVAYFSGKSWW
ncbi:MAG: hypothetical protein IAF38_18795 [Bacteroidia bacterium]|nr:hypothetical protein [Bacteroidia bacterium]